MEANNFHFISLFHHLTIIYLHYIIIWKNAVVYVFLVLSRAEIVGQTQLNKKIRIIRNAVFIICRPIVVYRELFA